MLTPPTDAAISDEEWKAFLSQQDFGQVIAPGRGRDHPVVTPSHYWYDGDRTIELHLHRANPVFAALAENQQVLFSVMDAYVYVPTYWNAPPGSNPYWGVPTSYYATVQASAIATPYDDPEELADLLRRQMKRMQPEGGHGPIEAGDTPYGRLLRAIRAIRLSVTDVAARFKFGGNKTDEHRSVIARHLRERGRPRDKAASAFLMARGVGSR